ncbi:MAG: PEP/pyruvate-binding domain-containing protein [Propioniciclava sp.]|uniref:PEP/pyruvate-binding domain-containing protein n=1 Tax=Propioniciclava sp. TaxID=2038686 RepID=UPI0039E24D47
MNWIAPLHTLTRDDLATAGGKGANLGELVRAGFDVPDGFVVTTAAYNAYVGEAGIADALRDTVAHSDAAPDGVPTGAWPSSAGDDHPQDGAAARALFDHPIPDDLVAAITEAYRALGSPVVAVRSSATAEDLADASFAGQQDSYLGIDGEDALLDAVRRCWASLWTDRAIAYRAKAGIGHNGVSLAVVVQRLVDADAAGVLFTANPANGRRHESVINAAFGLGEAVVGGEVTPDEIVLDDGQVIRRTVADKAVHTVRDEHGTHAEPLTGPRRTASVLNDEQAERLAALGRRVAEHFGAPQDIEWVLAGDQFWLTQSRPITALPQPTGPIPDEWPTERTDGMYMRASIVEQMPDPLSPLFADLIQAGVAASLRTMMGRYFGRDILRDADTDFPMVNGFAYYFYSTKAMGRMMRFAPSAMKVVVRSDGPMNGITLWRETGRPGYQKAVADWSARDAGTLPATELLTGAAALVAAGSDYYTYVQAVIPQAAMPEIMFTRLYHALVPGRPGTDKPPALTFLLGFESTPIRAERSLFALAQWCRATPGVARAVLDGRPLPAAYAADFGERLARHLDRFGHLTYNLDLMQPVAADDPAPVMAALKHAVAGKAADPDARLTHLASERRRAMRWLDDHLDPVRRRILHGWLEKAHRLGPLREDALADIGLGWPCARRLLRELGRRLAEAGVIADRDDVFWLTRAEADAAASALDAAEAHIAALTDEVERRKEVWRGRRLATPPGWLPETGFYYTLFKRFMPSNTEEQSGPTLTGLGASAGRATGPARVLRGPEDFAAMRPGDVLVAPITTPAYTPFFAMASAVVTDIGGPLSHSSIVAREYGIPAVLGTGSATRRIHDGDMITVDGERGIVHLDQEDSASR